MKLTDLINEYPNAKNLAPKTIRVYELNLQKWIRMFLTQKYDDVDFQIEDIDLPFIYQFEVFLNQQGLANSSRQEYSNKIRAVISYAFQMSYISKDVLVGYKGNLIKRDNSKKSESLDHMVSIAALDKIEREPAPRKYKRTRILFLIQTWSGFSYEDMNSYDVRKMERTDTGGNVSLFYNRSKTGELAILPLFPELKQLLDEVEYNIKPEQGYGGYVAALKGLFRQYGLSGSKIGTHTGRHVFGERMIMMGFNMSDVARMMGHSSVKVTEKTYAKVNSEVLHTSYNRIKAASSDREAIGQSGGGGNDNVSEVRETNSPASLDTDPT